MGGGEGGGSSKNSPTLLTLGAHSHVEGGAWVPSARGQVGIRSHASRGSPHGYLWEEHRSCSGDSLHLACITSDKHNVRVKNRKAAEEDGGNLQRNPTLARVEGQEQSRAPHLKHFFDRWKPC